MKEFFILESAYLFIGLAVLLITIFVTTRPFMGKGALKKGVTYVGTFILIAVFSHYYITKNRMNSVKEAFSKGKEILCENRIYTKGANYVAIKHTEGWKIENGYFVSPNYTRKFFLARCFVK